MTKVIFAYAVDGFAPEQVADIDSNAARAYCARGLARLAPAEPSIPDVEPEPKPFKPKRRRAADPLTEETELD